MPSYVFVVEGKTDKALLQTYTKNHIVITDGTNVSRETISYLKQLENYHNIVIITDPDKNGMKIRMKIMENLVQPIVIDVTRDEMKLKKKIGVAEMSRKSLFHKIKPYNTGTTKISEIDYYLFWTFCQTNLLEDEAKQAFLQAFSLLDGPTKKLHQALEYLGITIKEIEQWKKQ